VHEVQHLRRNERLQLDANGSGCRQTHRAGQQNSQRRTPEGPHGPSFLLHVSARAQSYIIMKLLINLVSVNPNESMPTAARVRSAHQRRSLTAPSLYL
jgi:hypothetical protein